MTTVSMFAGVALAMLIHSATANADHRAYRWKGESMLELSL
jgi:hypothetical protein